MRLLSIPYGKEVVSTKETVAQKQLVRPCQMFGCIELQPDPALFLECSAKSYDHGSRGYCVALIPINNTDFDLKASSTYHHIYD